MLVSFLITFREVLEAALIIGIIGAYVAKIGRKDLNRYIGYWIIIGIFVYKTYKEPHEMKPHESRYSQD